MPKNEVGFLVRYLFDGEQGREMLERIDRRVDRLPGQDNLHLLTQACRSPGVARRSEQPVSTSTSRTPPNKGSSLTEEVT